GRDARLLKDARSEARCDIEPACSGFTPFQLRRGEELDPSPALAKRAGLEALPINRWRRAERGGRVSGKERVEKDREERRGGHDSCDLEEDRPLKWRCQLSTIGRFHASQEQHEDPFSHSFAARRRTRPPRLGRLYL